MLIAGIDEAGRGSCLGPLVIAIALIEKKDEEKLIESGVKDSKLLTARQRNEMLAEIKRSVKEFSFTAVFPEELDLLMDRKSLNEIEAMRMGLLLNNLESKPAVVYVDAVDPIQENFSKRLKKYTSFKTIIKSEHKADERHPIVSAASIIAKVQRDLEIKKLEEEFGQLGSGYSHDEKTIAFIKKYLKQHKKLPSIARRSWDTSQKLLNERFQRKLF